MKEKLKIVLISLLILLVLIIIFIFNYYSNKSKVSAKEKTKEIIKKEPKEEKEEIKTIKIDIKGYVNNPGVYELNEGSRVIDAINISNGLKENADTSIINLSKKLEDEMVIIVYSIDEIKEYKEKLKQSEEIVKEKTKEIVCPDIVNKACINTTTKENKTQKEDNSKTIVNINTATKEQLMTINGIGEGKAESIISYREENGNFSSIEDIKNVSGIGDSLYEKIKDYITV